MKKGKRVLALEREHGKPIEQILSDLYWSDDEPSAEICGETLGMSRSNFLYLCKKYGVRTRLKRKPNL